MWNQDEDIEMVEKRLPRPCPFCTGDSTVKDRWITKQGERSGPNYTKRRLFYVNCTMCGAQGPVALDAMSAVVSWNWRSYPEWQPLPSGGVSFLLPGTQKYQHLLVNEGGRVSLLDYAEQEITEGRDGIVASVDVDLGRFRVCLQRKARNDQEEGAEKTT